MRRVISHNDPASDERTVTVRRSRVREMSLGAGEESRSPTMIEYKEPFVFVPYHKPEPTMGPYDRRGSTGLYAVAWLLPDGVMFSDHCRDLGQALRCTRMYKRAPTWVVHGLERELDVAQLCLGFQSSDWLDSKSLDKAIRSIIHVVATSNIPAPSTYIQPVKAPEHIVSSTKDRK